MRTSGLSEPCSARLLAGTSITPDKLGAAQGPGLSHRDGRKPRQGNTRLGTIPRSGKHSPECSVHRRGTRHHMGALTEIDVLWITAGLGCDGDTIAMTAATQPSLEELMFGALPFVPKMKLHNPFLAYENGEEFMQLFHQAAEGKLAPFILVIEGSIPNEKNKSEGYWATFGTDQKTGQPILTCDWIDRLAPNAWAVIAAGTCATYGGIHAMEGNPTGCMGLPDYLGWKWKSRAGVPIVCVPGCPVQPDNMTETILYLLNMVVGKAPMIPLDEALRPTWLF